MPDYSELTTQQLLDAIKSHVNLSGISMWDELNGRIIESGDLDDDTQHRGGIRPTKLPLNP